MSDAQPRIKVNCGGCHKEFEMIASSYRRRVKESRSWEVYCSATCELKKLRRMK